MWPDEFYGGAAVIKSIMSVAVWSAFFPDLAKAYGPTTQVDFRCGFGEEFLKQGGLQHGIVSKIHFKEDNKVEADLHFGCAVYAFDKPMTLDMNALMELISSLSIDKNDARWKTSQSFYTSVKTSFDMEFGESANSANPIELLA